MKASEAIKLLARLPSDEDIAIAWWTEGALLENFNEDEFKHFAAIVDKMDKMPILDEFINSYNKHVGNVR